MLSRHNLFITLIALLCAGATLAAQNASCTEPIPESKPVDGAVCTALNTKTASKAPVCLKEMVASSSTASITRASSDFDPAAVDNIPERRNGERFILNLLNKDCKNSDEDLNKYLKGMAIIAAPALVFFVLNLCCCTWCTCCHTCCKINTKFKVCKCIPNADHEYNCCEKTAPVVVWSLFSLCLFIFAIVGIANGIYEFNDSLVGGVCQVDNTYLRFSSFLRDVTKPLQKLKVDFNSGVKDLESAAQIDPQLGANVEAISPKFATVKNKATASKNQATDKSVICTEAWDEIIESIETARKESYDEGKELENTLIDVQKDIDEAIVSKSNKTKVAIEDGVLALSKMQEQLNTTMNPINIGGGGFNLIELATVIRNNRDNMAFAGFGWLFLALVFAVVGIVCMKVFRKEENLEKGPDDNPEMVEEVLILTCMGKCGSRFACCSWVLVLFFGVIGALLALVWMPVAAGGRDVCKILPSLPRDIGRWQGGKVAMIGDTCWNTTGNLFEGFELGKQVDVDALSFDNFTNTFANVNISTTGIDKLEAGLTAASFAPCRTGAAAALTDLTKSINAARTQVEFAESAFQSSTTVADIKKNGEKVKKTIQVAVEGFKVESNCYFIACTWQETIDVLCTGGFVESLTWLATSQLLIAGLAIPYAITVMFVMQRMAGFGPIRNAEGSRFGLELGGISPQKNAGEKYAMQATNMQDTK